MRALALLGSSVALPAAGVDRAAPLASQAIEEIPYRDNGLYTSSTGRGSGALVHPRVVLTAAHVVFDEDKMTWSTSNRFEHRRHQNYSKPPAHTTWPLTAIHRWSAYSTAVRNSGDSIWPFNVDFAAVYSISTISPDYGTYDVRPRGDISLLRDEGRKMIVGYPLDSSNVTAVNQGRLHATGPRNWTFYDYFGGETTVRKEALGFDYAILQANSVQTFSGNSGGPVYFEDLSDGGRWLQAAVITGGGYTREHFSILRVIDEAADKLIQAAIQDSGLTHILRPQDVRALHSAEGGAIVSWTDTSPEDAGWQIYRNDGHGWSEVGVLEASSGTGSDLIFHDPSAAGGAVYLYKVRALTEEDEVSPWSAPARAEVPGAQIEIGTALGAPWLTWSTGGDLSWVAHGNEASTGKIRSLSETWLESRVLGPGVLTFDWGVSCEAPELPEIYDNLTFYIDGKETRKIYGEASGNRLTFQLGSGTHEIRWVYTKDPYAIEGQDRGWVRNVSWRSSNPSQRIAGAYDTGEGWHHAHWFGYHSVAAGGDWIFHPAFGTGIEQGGWLYASGTEDALWLYSNSPGLGWMWTSPAYFPRLWSDERQEWVAWLKVGNHFYAFGSGEYFTP